MTTQRILPQAAVAFAASLLLLPLVACHSKTAATPENFTVALNAYFTDHPDCLFPNPPSFPYETTDPEKTRQMNALVASQLLTVHQAVLLHESRYTVTAAGARVAPRFCFGHRIATAIDSSTPPTNNNGMLQTQVAYHYTLQDVPVWAKTDQMRAAFPAMAQAIGGAASDKATLGKTMVDWQVVE
ncbi:MAG TPA: hypothetical protein VII58_06835 [Acidobacteriaceae bacterium]